MGDVTQDAASIRATLDHDCYGISTSCTCTCYVTVMSHSAPLTLCVCDTSDVYVRPDFLSYAYFF